MGVAGVVALWAYFGTVAVALQVAAYLCVAGFTVGSIVALCAGWQAWGRSLFVLNALVFVIIGGLCILHWCGVLDDCGSLEQLKHLILSTGGWAYLVYVVLQFLNVVLLPLPGFLFILAAISIFGVWPAFWVTLLVTWVGSVVCFWFGRTFGNQAVVWCIGRESAERYQKLLGTKGNLLFLIMQILPFFPDDLLCMIAGLTRMKFSFFIITMAIAKPLYIGTVCVFGSGALIPLTGWGIPVWIVIIMLLAIGFALFCKYQAPIENWFAKITHQQPTAPATPSATQPTLTTVPDTSSVASGVTTTEDPNSIMAPPSGA